MLRKKQTLKKTRLNDKRKLKTFKLIEGKNENLDENNLKYII